MSEIIQILPPVVKTITVLPVGSGSAGARGPKGDKGDAGPQGPAGAVGPGGAGSVGPQGPKGDTGAAGPQGVQGLKGDTGAQGPAGPSGPTGAQGNQGTAGAQGLTGPQGSTGATGSQGPQGLQGVAGPVGPAGLTWRGAYSAVTAYSVNDAVSDTGTNGVASSYFCVQAGTNHAPTEGASNAYWALLAQEGPQGPQGIQGPAGTTGSQGIQGIQGPQGPQGVKGDTGATGAQGPAGSGGAITNELTQADYGLKAWNGSPISFNTSASGPAAATFMGGVFRIGQDTPIQGAVFGIAGAGSGLTATNCWGVIYRTDGTLVDRTVDCGTAWSTQGFRPAALLGGTQTLTAGTYYFLWKYAGTTSPTWVTSGSLMPWNSFALAPLTGYQFYGYTAAAQPATVPASTMPALLTTQQKPAWFGLY